MQWIASKLSQLKTLLSTWRTQNWPQVSAKLSALRESFSKWRGTIAQVRTRLEPPFKALCEAFGKLPFPIRVLLIVLPALFLMLCSSGCANTLPTPTVIQQCKGVDQFLVATQEPEANNKTEGSKDETHAELQGALAACNLDKKAARDAIWQIQKGAPK